VETDPRDLWQRQPLEPQQETLENYNAKARELEREGRSIECGVFSSHQW
jgi:hypothetical protein